MPNIATSALYITGLSDALDAIEQLGCANEPQVLDFQRVRPIPPELLDESSPLNRAGAVLSPYLLAGEQRTPELLEQCLDAYAQASGECRHTLTLEGLKERFPDLELSASVHLRMQTLGSSWQQWDSQVHSELWGVRGPAHGGEMRRVSPEKLCVVVDTAWVPPEGIVCELVQRFDIRIRLTYTVGPFNGMGALDYYLENGMVQCCELLCFSPDEFAALVLAPDELPAERHAAVEAISQSLW